MYTTLLVTHKIIVNLFLLHYILKLVLLIFNKTDTLSKYSKFMKVPEMILSVGFLVSGGWMLVKTPIISTFLIVKLVCVFASIPLAVIGFKRANKPLAALAVFLILAAYGLAEMNRSKGKTGGKIDTTAVADPIEVGKTVYGTTCVSCHGTDGKMGVSDAKDLTATQLTTEEQKALIRNGKNAMPAYKDLTDAQVDGVVQYIATFKHQ